MTTSLAVTALLAAAVAPKKPPVDFVAQIKPIFDRACISCHGPAKHKGDLRLDGRTAAFTGGLSGPALVPGKSADSVLMKRVLGQDGEDRMPLEAPALSAAETATLRRWIDEGAVWPEDASPTTEVPQHWAYRKPQRPPVPMVKRSEWPANPIDAFVLARLEREALTPSPEASRATLLRRLSLDLTGLPPSPQEIDDFVSDRRSDAYQRAVDRLLASPHHGERWARPWLDLARYADSNGFEKDRPRVAWKWRDWVIDALNRNVSFKQFTIDQLAGDMLPNATVSQRIATGFHRNTLLNQEGGVDDEEARWETLIDRVGTTATVWLGSTVACAQCHNHKFDPFSQKDFYRLLAFFDNGEYHIEGSAPESYAAEPEVDLPTDAQRAARDELQRRLDAARAQLDPDSAAVARDMVAWERSVRDAERDWQTLHPRRLTAKGGTKLAVLPDGSILATGADPPEEVYDVEAALPPGRTITGFRLEAIGDARLPAGGPGRAPDGNFFLAAFDVTADRHAVKLVRARDDEHAGEHGAQSVVLANAERGWAIDVGVRPRPLRRQAVFVPESPVAASRLSIRLAHGMPRIARNLGRFRLSVTTAANPTSIVAVPTRLHAALAQAPARRDDRSRRELARVYAAEAPQLAPVREEVERCRRQISALQIPVALVLQERPGHARPSTHLRVRGAFTSVGEQVWAGTPKSLPPLPDDAPANRLGLAMWLVSEDNPLTARVTVNRIWAEYFGHGLVETTEDFGTQGAPPTHPELLDWLATEFMRSGWDMKALHRLIVTSATYRQSSRVTPALLERDPYNKLLARGPRFRLDAEAIRDGALAAAGLLSLEVGGPSVYPVQPEGIWDQPYSGLTWTTSAGQDRYRRGLYTFIRRTAPYPMLTTFDAPTRETCAARRLRTNTPLQALTTLNDPVFFEAAQALARRMVAEGGPTSEGRAERGFRLVVGRRPKPDELRVLLAAYRRERQELARADADARAISAGGDADRGAWTIVANVLLNLDEAVTKE